MRKRIFSLMLATVMLMAFVPCVASAYSGTKYGDYLYYEVNDDGTEVSITDCDESATGELEIPAEIDGLPVTSIGSGAFEYCSGLTSITIPDSVTSIGEGAFYYCTGLTSVTIPDSVTSIGRSAFEWCSSLTDITIPAGVTNIDSNTFYSCLNLTDVTIPDSVTTIGGAAFSRCSGLTSITIPDSVTSIGIYAFYDTAIYDDESNWVDDVLYISDYLIEAKESISGDYTIKDGTLCIANYAFYDCTGLTSITIPNSVTNISNYAFYDCTGLTSVKIPDSVTSIGNYAFYGCTGLASVTIGNGVTSIGSYAFYNCLALTDVYYTGSKEQWSNITIDDYNSALTTATIHYNYNPQSFEVNGSSVTNTDTENSYTATIIIAKYTNGIFDSFAKCEEVTFAAGETKTFTVPENGKLFVWDSLEGMRPLTK